MKLDLLHKIHLGFILFLLLVIAGLCTAFYFVIEKHQSQLSQIQKGRIDTLYVEKYKPVEVQPNNQPIHVTIYNQPDTAARKKAERDPIIIGEKFKPGEIDVTTIDSTGHIKTEAHKTDPDSKVIVNSSGQIEEKKRSKAHKILVKAWKGTKTGLIIIGTGFLVYETASHL